MTGYSSMIPFPPSISLASRATSRAMRQLFILARETCQCFISPFSFNRPSCRASSCPFVISWIILTSLPGPVGMRPEVFQKSPVLLNNSEPGDNRHWRPPKPPMKCRNGPGSDSLKAPATFYIGKNIFLWNKTVLKVKL